MCLSSLCCACAAVTKTGNNSLDLVLSCPNFTGMVPLRTSLCWFGSAWRRRGALLCLVQLQACRAHGVRIHGSLSRWFGGILRGTRRFCLPTYLQRTPPPTAFSTISSHLPLSRAFCHIFRLARCVLDICCGAFGRLRTVSARIFVCHTPRISSFPFTGLDGARVRRTRDAHTPRISHTRFCAFCHGLAFVTIWRRHGPSSSANPPHLPHRQCTSPGARKRYLTVAQTPFCIFRAYSTTCGVFLLVWIYQHLPPYAVLPDLLFKLVPVGCLLATFPLHRDKDCGGRQAKRDSWPLWDWAAVLDRHTTSCPALPPTSLGWCPALASSVSAMCNPSFSAVL